MKVLNVCVRIDKESGGGSVATLEISRMLMSEGIEVDTWIVVDENDKNLLDISDLSTKCFYTSFGSSRFRFSLSFIRAIRNDVSQYDVVLVGGLYLFPNVITSYFCKAKNIPYVLFPYDSFSPTKLAHHGLRKKIFRMIFDNKMIKHAALIQAANEAEKKQIASYTKSNRNIFVVPYGFHVNTFKRQQDISLISHLIPWNMSKQKTLLYLARVSETKGVETLLAAFEKLVNQDDSYSLLIVGPAWDKRYNDSLILKYKDLISNKKVVFAGMVSAEEKYACFQFAYLYILPSYSENFGITVLEAAANGIVPIITDSVPWPELEQENAGYIVPTKSEDAIVDAILAYTRLPDVEKDRMKQNAISLANNYDFHVVSKQYIRVLVELSTKR